MIGRGTTLFAKKRLLNNDFFLKSRLNNLQKDLGTTNPLRIAGIEFFFNFKFVYMKMTQFLANFPSPPLAIVISTKKIFYPFRGEL